MKLTSPSKWSSQSDMTINCQSTQYWLLILENQHSDYPWYSALDQGMRPSSRYGYGIRSIYIYIGIDVWDRENRRLGVGLWRWQDIHWIIRSWDIRIEVLMRPRTSYTVYSVDDTFTLQSTEYSRVVHQCPVSCLNRVHKGLLVGNHVAGVTWPELTLLL